MDCQRLARPFLLAVLLGVLGSALIVESARAATIPVTTSADDNGGNPLLCSLREAVQAANTNLAADGCPAGDAGGIDQITFTPGSTASTIFLSGGEIVISSNVQIVGNGAPLTRVDGQRGTPAATRVFNVGAGATVTIESLTIQNGGTPALGGGIQNAGTLTVTNTMFTDNTAGNGGAIANLANSTLTVSDSTFDGNATTGVGGGGILNSGLLTVRNSALIDNRAPINGGGINVQPNGTLTLINSTVSGNTSGSLGGGVASLGTLNIVNSTLRGNSGGGGSGIATSNALLSLRATVIANAAAGPNCSLGGAITNLGSNVADDFSCFPNSGTDQVVPDVKLGPLADNDGPTLTHALLDGSPAIDAVQGPCTNDGTAGGTPIATDQRGAPRPVGAGCDAGAFERQRSTIPFSIANASVSEGNSGTTNATFTVTLHAVSSQPVSVQYATADGTARAGSDYTATSGTLTFNPGEQTKPIDVPVIGDTLFEPEETFTVTLSNPTNAPLAIPQAVGTIRNDDQQVACTPRPNVQTRPAPSAPGRLLVTIEGTPLNTGQNNRLIEVRFGQLQNARVIHNGQPITAGQTVTLPPNTVETGFSLERITAGQTTMVPFTVVDGCGEWPTFVGGGPDAF